VPRLTSNSDGAKRINQALPCWRQGDLTLDEDWYVHIGDGAVPLTDAAEEAAAGASLPRPPWPLGARAPLVDLVAEFMGLSSIPKVNEAE
jgi:hypothetical protein